MRNIQEIKVKYENYIYNDCHHLNKYRQRVIDKICGVKIIDLHFSIS